MKPYTAHDFRDTTIDSGFWKNRQEINAKVTIHNVYKRFSDTGRFDAFRCDWREGMPNKPHYFWDSDVAKWLESVAYIREKNECPDLERIVDDVVDRIEQNQDESGYFNIYFTVVEPEQRWQRRTDHELYCAGHLMEAAVAYHIATGKNKFLNLMRKCADHIEKVFMIDNSAAFTTCGHEEIELALIKLYKATGEPRYLHLAEFFLDSRGQRQEQAYDWTTPLSDQSHLPVREQFTAQGHCVRALYLYIAMADLARLTGDEALLTACKALFDDIIRHKMYITGGVGSSRLGEAFTIPYDLPNLTAYAETCASIALIFFCNRMQSLLIDSKYADTAERALYNGFLSGVSLDGKSFFYENPLELDPRLIQKDASVKNKTRFAIPRRVEVFDCSCCPPNVTRLIASVADHLYTYDEQTIFIHHFMSGVSQLGASGVKITQQTDYPKTAKSPSRYRAAQAANWPCAFPDGAIGRNTKPPPQKRRMAMLTLP